MMKKREYMLWVVSFYVLTRGAFACGHILRFAN